MQLMASAAAMASALTWRRRAKRLQVLAMLTIERVDVRPVGTLPPSDHAPASAKVRSVARAGAQE
eukprot:3855934-Pleurochrysis_carterae.AAC.1